MKKFTMFLLLMILSAGILAGCGNASNQTGKVMDDNQTAEKAEEASFPVEVTDGTGEKLTIKEEPERIVSVLPSNTEIAFALGLDKQIVGVTDNDTYPEAVKDKEKVGGMELNIEKILSLKPQLVLADTSTDEKALKQIKDAGITVLTVKQASDFDGVYDSIGLVAKATGTQEKSDQIIQDMKKKLESLQKKANKVKKDQHKKVYMEISPSPEIFTAGNNTFMNELLQIIHADNIAADEEGWAKMSEEAIIADNPDVIITTYGFYMDNPVKEVTSRDGWDKIAAVKNKQVFDINPDLVDRPGPRLVEGVEALGKAIYPDVFAD